MTTTLAHCPMGRDPHVADTDMLFPCPTMLQPYRGRLVLGIAAHLQLVHELPESGALAVATSWVEAGCRATR